MPPKWYSLRSLNLRRTLWHCLTIDKRLESGTIQTVKLHQDLNPHWQHQAVTYRTTIRSHCMAYKILSLTLQLSEPQTYHNCLWTQLRSKSFLMQYLLTWMWLKLGLPSSRAYREIQLSTKVVFLPFMNFMKRGNNFIFEFQSTLMWFDQKIWNIFSGWKQFFTLTRF